MGLAMMGNNFGGLVFPPIIGLTVGLASWQAAYVILGLLALLVVVFSLAVVREFPTDRRIVTDRSDATRAEALEPPEAALAGWSVRDVLRSKTFYVIALSILIGTFTYSAILPQVFAHLTDEGASLRAASAAVAVMALFGMTGKLAFGYLAERITARHALMLCLVGQSGFLLLMLDSSEPAVMRVSVPLFGLCMGAFGALFPLIVQESFGVRRFGSVMGLINLTTVISFSAGPLLAGASYDITGNYNMAFITVSAMFLMAVILLSQAGQPQPRVQPRRRPT